jgi:hypothetical protein
MRYDVTFASKTDRDAWLDNKFPDCKSLKTKPNIFVTGRKERRRSRSTVTR